MILRKSSVRDAYFLYCSLFPSDQEGNETIRAKQGKSPKEKARFMFACLVTKINIGVKDQKEEMLTTALLLCIRNVLGGGASELRINTARELMAFSKVVNSGENYTGTTVFLDADIDFSGGLSLQFEPIGKDEKVPFRGTFDGQGHVISNLAMSLSVQFVGLFGCIEDATVRNVVMDSSCSVTNSYKYSFSDSCYTAGVVCMAYGKTEACVIESVTNTASVTFSGKSSWSSYLGGVVGHLVVSGHDDTIRNCANYGAVAHPGTVTSQGYIGGIVGAIGGQSGSKAYVQNCLNYGKITYTITQNYFSIGGISGEVYADSLHENCVNLGQIVSRAVNSPIGNIVGLSYSSGETTLSHCYWTSDVAYKACGKGCGTVADSASFNAAFELNETVTVGNYTGTSLIGNICHKKSS